jgi:hypothetical protein
MDPVGTNRPIKKLSLKYYRPFEIKDNLWNRLQITITGTVEDSPCLSYFFTKTTDEFIQESPLPDIIFDFKEEYEVETIYDPEIDFEFWGYFVFS